MITFHDTENNVHYRVTVRVMRVRDGIAIAQERESISEQYAGDGTMLLSLFNFPLLRHGSMLETSSDGENWLETLFTQDLFLDMPEAFIVQWLKLVMTANPQHGYDQIQALKKNLTSLMGNADSSED